MQAGRDDGPDVAPCLRPVPGRQVLWWLRQGRDAGKAARSGGDGLQTLMSALAVGMEMRPAGREAQAGFGFAVAVPVSVNVDAAGNGSQHVVPVRGDQRGGQAGRGHWPLPRSSRNPPASSADLPRNSRPSRAM